MPKKSVDASKLSVLKKSEEVTETLSKADVANKMFELKKSGNNDVTTDEIYKAEFGTAFDTAALVKKYNLK